MPSPFGRYLSGLYNIPFQPSYRDDASRLFGADFGNAWGMMSSPYATGGLAGTNFARWLENYKSEAERRWEAENARRIGAGGGLADQIRPDDWLSQVFNPLQIFQQQRPQARGETQMPFTRFLRF